ncbi:MAG: monooxygenase [Actinomycetia bacterium]|nr:monooxygenase [Actinomycetes bacterium]MCP4224061.1 monooxygenase [Actinomycetes bacterium]MCP5035800.1 monooxygenase [Actinomycetes bacterium]
MITALVQFTLPEPISAENMAELSEANAPLYKDKKGLIRKYYVRSEDGAEVGGVYLWESKAEAKECYDVEWLKRVTKSYGSTPVITWLETPVIVDNRHDEIVVD